MTSRKKSPVKGYIMLLVFAVVLAAFFTPMFQGKNGLDYLDSLFNSISKGSANYIPGVVEKTKAFEEKRIQAAFAMQDDTSARQAARMLTAAGAQATAEGRKVKMEGDFGTMLQGCLSDAWAMYDNQGAKVSERYGINEREALYLWWNILRGLEKDLKSQKKFNEAKFAATVNQKAVELAYNYYGVQSQSIGSRWGMVLFSLVFYVVYTMWYGFGILYCFEGWGLKIGH